MSTNILVIESLIEKYDTIDYMHYHSVSMEKIIKTSIIILNDTRTSCKKLVHFYFHNTLTLPSIGAVDKVHTI